MELKIGVRPEWHLLNPQLTDLNVKSQLSSGKVQVTKHTPIPPESQPCYILYVKHNYSNFMA